MSNFDYEVPQSIEGIECGRSCKNIKPWEWYERKSKSEQIERFL